MVKFLMYRGPLLFVTLWGLRQKLNLHLLPRSYLILSRSENKSPVIDFALVQFVFVKTQFPWSICE